MASDLHVAAARLVALVNEPGTLEDFSLAVETVLEALAAEDEAGGPVETPAAESEPVAETVVATAENATTGEALVPAAEDPTDEASPPDKS